MKQKTCFKCQTTKPLTEYYKHPFMGDGHLGKCKDCTRNDASIRREQKLMQLGCALPKLESL